MTMQKELHRALNQKAGFEVVEESSTPSQLRLLGRIPLDREGQNMNNWLIIMRQLLSQSATSPWKVDISKHYFLLAGKVVYAWRVIFQAEAIDPHLGDIATVVNSAPQSSRTELTEIPLAGASRDRNSTVGGRRGAGPIGAVAVGPIAMHAKQMGTG